MNYACASLHSRSPPNHSLYMSVNLSPQICGSKVKPVYMIPLLRNLGGEKFIVFASSVANSPSQDVEGISGKGAHASACLLGCNDQWDGCRKGKLLYMFQVKRFKKLLQQADHDSCPVHSIPSSSIESLRPIYKSGNFWALIL
ncbi:hypothetical protein WN943_012216 [Citrus x changshan-huyou]